MRLIAIVLAAYASLSPLPEYYRWATVWYCMSPVQAERLVELGADEAAYRQVAREYSVFERCQVGTIAYRKPEWVETISTGRESIDLYQVLMVGRVEGAAEQIFAYPVQRFVLVRRRLNS